MSLIRENSLIRIKNGLKSKYLRSFIHESFLFRLKPFLTKFGSDEAEQFAVRFLIAGIVATYASLGEHGHEVEMLSMSYGQTLAFGYLITLLLANVCVYFITLKRQLVRVLMMAIDVVFFSTAMGVIPESTTPLFFVYLLVILGSGFRYGNNYLFAGMAMCTLGFSAAFLSSEYWIMNKSFGFGVLFILVSVSIYVSLFIRRLNIAKTKLEIAVAKADAANEAKTNFLANMSHELRTPLNGVITVSDLLSETQLSSTQREYADTIQSSSRTLLELINDVLDFSKIESEKVILDNVCFDLYACISEVVKIIKPLADRKNIAIYNNVSSHSPQFIYGDPVRLKQILINLANNAVKFTEQGHVSIHTYATNVSSDSAQYHFEVIDTGIGISHDAQQKIFERFVQEDDSTTRRFGGTGLGTSIAKQLVELMGGEIGVSSNPGKGSRFWVEVNLPIASSQDFESLEADILLVSNNKKLISKWKGLLDSWGCKYVVRSSIDAAVKVLHVWRHSKSKCSVVFDDGALHMSPIHAAQLMRESGVKNMSLMLSTMNPMQANSSEVKMYYDAVLDMPVDSRQLYHALMGSSKYEKQEGVVSLSSHIDQQNNLNHTHLNILIAEDQSTNQFVFRRIIETQGHSVTIVDDGQQALDILGVERFDLTIVDLNMPHVSGIEVMKMFKFMDPDNEMPFIVVTANCGQETLSECQGLADAVLVKPVEKQQLLNVIYKLASNKYIYPDSGALSENQLFDVPELDASALDNMLGAECDDGFLKELFSIFHRDAESLVDKLKGSIKELKKLPEAKNYAHALKGIANNVSAKKLAAIAKYCEDAVENNPDVIKQSEQMIAELDNCLIATKRAMQNYLSFKRSELVDS